MESVSGVIAEGRATGWSDVRSSRGQPSRSVIKGRDGVLEELRELASSVGEIPRLVVLEGPRGAGTSTLAGELVGQVKRTWQRGSREDPVVVQVDVSSLNHTKGDPSRGVATAILRKFNVDFSPAGYPTGQVAQWALRRISVQTRPVIVWLDQVHENTRIMAEALEPLLEPERFMETGAEFPPILVVVSGTGKANLGSWAEGHPTKWIHIPLLPRSVLEEIVVERARGLGCEISPGAVSKVLDIMVTLGRGLSIMGEILQVSVVQATEKSGRAITPSDIISSRVRARGKANRRALEVRVLEVIREAGGQVTMGELMEQVTRDLTQTGEAHRTASTLRRLAVRLEQLGLVERQVTLGGEGGTHSTLSLPGHPSLR